MALGARLDELFQPGFDHLLKKLSCSSGREKHLRAIGVRPLVGCFFALRVHGWVRNTQDPGKLLTIPGTCFP